MDDIWVEGPRNEFCCHLGILLGAAKDEDRVIGRDLKTHSKAKERKAKERKGKERRVRSNVETNEEKMMKKDANFFGELDHSVPVVWILVECLDALHLFIKNVVIEDEMFLEWDGTKRSHIQLGLEPVCELIEVWNRCGHSCTAKRVDQRE